MEYGLQLYSVRDITQKGLQNAMQQVKDLGYSFVEFAGFFGNSAPEVGRMLRETGLGIRLGRAHPEPHYEYHSLSQDYR